MKTYRIHLISHGLTTANEEGRYVGKTNLPLSPLGLTDLLNKKATSKYPYGKRFFSSPMMRCTQSLEVLYPDNQHQIVPELAECDFGDWEGKDLGELKNDERFALWAAGQTTEVPNGENSEIFSKRVTDAFINIVSQVVTDGDTDVVICTHGGVIMMIMAAFAYPQHPIHSWGSQPGTGFSLRVTPGIWMREPVSEFYANIPEFKNL